MTTKRCITSGAFEFDARLELEAPPKTCQEFLDLLPYKQKIIHVRSNGEGCWIPLGDAKFGLTFESANSCPAPVQMLLYPGRDSETEMLIAHGSVAFASGMGALAGNHFLTIEDGFDSLEALGEKTLWEGAQSILFERLDWAWRQSSV